MSSYTIEELVTPLTAAEIKTSIYSVIAAVGTDHTTWKTGAVIRVLIAALSIVLASFSSLVSAIARAGWLDLADDSWLPLVAKHVYNKVRFEADFASGVCTLTNAGAGVFSLEPDDLVLSNGKHEYRNRLAVELDAFETLTDVQIYCVTAGSEGSTGVGTITSIVEPTMGDVSVTNPDPLVGSEQESRPALVARSRAQLQARSPNGPRDAYYVASVEAVRSDGTLVGVTRVSPPTADGQGALDFYVATAAGAVPGDAADPETDLGAVNLAVQRNAAPLGVTVDVHSAAALVVNVAGDVWVYDVGDVSAAKIKADADDALLLELASVPIGGTIIPEIDEQGRVYADTLSGVIKRVDSRIFRVVLSNADQDVAVGEAPSLGTVTLNVNKVKT